MRDEVYQLYTTGTDEEIRDYVKNENEYKLRRFVDHVVEFSDVRIETDLGHGRIKHEPFEGQIFQLGTELNAETLGHLDLGIFMLWTRLKEQQELINDLLLQVVALKGAAINNMPNNIYFINFLDGDMEVIDGWYDEANGRVVC